MNHVMVVFNNPDLNTQSFIDVNPPSSNINYFDLIYVLSLHIKASIYCHIIFKKLELFEREKKIDTYDKSLNLSLSELSYIKIQTFSFFKSKHLSKKSFLIFR